ncbi:hypothetical protein DENSPDRAFT_887126 [Dentipellis sp. KUC8613]|nr:hypothetical protein DENSPDRAFT_887126 [Dentipellis sp. KUC8613]
MPHHVRPLGASNSFAPPRNRPARLSNDAARAFHARALLLNACAPPSCVLAPTPSLSRAATAHSGAYAALSRCVAPRRARSCRVASVRAVSHPCAPCRIRARRVASVRAVYGPCAPSPARLRHFPPPHIVSRLWAFSRTHTRPCRARASHIPPGRPGSRLCTPSCACAPPLALSHPRSHLLNPARAVSWPLTPVALCCMPTTPSSHLRRPPRVSTRRASAVVPRPRVAVSRPYAAVLRSRICDTASRASAILARPCRTPMSTRRCRFVPVRHPFALVRRRFAPACPCRPVPHFRRPRKLPSSFFAPCRTLFASHGVASHPVGHLVPHLAVSVPRTAVLAVFTPRPVVSRPTASSCASPRRLRAPPRRLRAASLALNTPPCRLCAALRALGPRSAFFAAPAVGHLAATAPSVRHAAPSFTTVRGLCAPPCCFRVAPRSLSCAAITLNPRLTNAVSRPTNVAALARAWRAPAAPRSFVAQRRRGTHTPRALAPPRPVVRPDPRAAIPRHRATIVLDAPPSHPHHAPYASRASPRATITPLAAVVAAPAGRTPLAPPPPRVSHSHASPRSHRAPRAAASRFRRAPRAAVAPRAVPGHCHTPAGVAGGRFAPPAVVSRPLPPPR